MKALKRILRGNAGAAEVAPRLRVLMVCTGNICRSPTAEGVLRAKLTAQDLHRLVAVDSAGTHGFHVRNPPDPRTQAHALRRGYDLSGLRARRVVAEDFERFDWVLAMDQDNLEWLRDSAPERHQARVGLLMEHAVRFRHLSEVPDPYYGAEQGFEQVLDLVEDACSGLLVRLSEELGRLPPRSGGNA